MFTAGFNKTFAFATVLFLLFGVAALWFDLPFLILFPFAIILAPIVLNISFHKTTLLFFGLIALLPLSTEINFTPALGLDMPDELLMLVLTGLFFLKLVYQPSIFPKHILFHPLSLLLALHLVWIVIASIYSMDSWLSLKFALAKTWFIVPFVILPSIVLNDKASIKKLALLLLVPMLFVVMQSLVRHAFYGFSFEGIKNTLSPFFRNHVNYSAMLVCLIAIGITVYTLTPKESKNRRWLRASLSIALVAIVVAYSRGAWVAAIVGVVSMWFIKKKLSRWFIGIGVVAMLLFISWLGNENRYLSFASDYNQTVFHQDIGEHLAATIQLKDVSNAERFYRWTAAASMIAEKPITGFGPNNFYNYYRPYAMGPFKTWVSDNPEHSSVHNYFLLTALEQGIPGLLFFCLLFVAMIVYSEKLYHSLRDRFYKNVALCIGVVLMMIGSLIFMSDLVETDKIGSLFWLSLGMLFVLSRKREAEQLN